MNGWIGVDLDGTLAEYHGWPADGGIGAPIPATVERVKAWIAEGIDVRIFTARVWPNGIEIENTPWECAALDSAKEQYVRIASWCVEHIGKRLPITCCKDYGMVELWDDRAVQVIPNTGKALMDGK